MTDRPVHLPDYRHPPIDEVVIAAQFQPIPDLTESHIRDFWKIVRGEYPIAEHQPRLEGPIESSGPPEPFTLQFPSPGIIPPSQRTWMISEDDDFLIQVQNSRFIQNWRRRQNTYNHFEEIRDKFWDSFNKFRTFLSSLELPIPVVQQVELNYLNWIPDIPMAEFFLPTAATVVTIDGAIREPEEQSWSARYLLGDSEGTIQRLYVQCLPAVRPLSPGERGSQLGLIFRTARAAGLSDEEIAESMDFGRAIIVETFTQITTPAAHEIWGRYK